MFHEGNPGSVPSNTSESHRWKPRVWGNVSITVKMFVPSWGRCWWVICRHCCPALVKVSRAFLPTHIWLELGLQFPGIQLLPIDGAEPFVRLDLIGSFGPTAKSLCWVLLQQLKKIMHQDQTSKQSDGKISKENSNERCIYSYYILTPLSKECASVVTIGGSFTLSLMILCWSFCLLGWVNGGCRGTQVLRQQMRINTHIPTYHRAQKRVIV